MPTEFYSALRHLVKAHAREVHDLQNKIGERRNSAEFSPAQVFEDGLEDLLSSLSRNDLRTIAAPWNIPDMVPCRPDSKRPRTPRDAYRESGTQKRPEIMEMQLESALFLSGSKDCIEESVGQRNTNKDSVEQSFGHQTTDSAACNAGAVERWFILTQGVLIQSYSAEYVLHPGWVLERKSKENSIHDRGSFAVPDRGSVRVLVSTEMRKAALAEKERESGRILFLSSGKATSSLFGSSRYGRRKTLLMHPDYPLRRFWILLCLLVFVYEALILTMAPFGIRGASWANALELFSACFWLLDIGMNFTCGIYINGGLELRLPVIALRYAKTWFAFDVVVVSCQFAGVLIDAVNDKMNATLVLRVVRIIRSIRLGRIIFWLKHEVGLSRVWLKRGKLSQVIAGMYIFSHCSACFVYEVGKYDGGWISQYRDRLEDDSNPNSIAHNYLVCLHWALSQLQGNVDVYPGTSTTGNLLFVVISSCCSIVALTLFVSSATDILSDVRQQTQSKIEEQRLFEEFFGRYEVSPEIKQRANYTLQLRKEQQRAIECHERDQEALMKFPAKLRSLLRVEMWASWITWHPVFAYLCKQKGSVFAKVCANALCVEMYEPKDDVFIDGDLSMCAHIITRGEFLMSVCVDNIFKNMGGGHAFGEPTPSKGSSTTTKSATAVKRYGTQNSAASQGVKRYGTQNSALSSARGRSPTKTYDGTFTLRSSKTSSAQAQINAFLDEGKSVKKILSGQLVSEISLWMPWMHVGDLSSAHHGQCLQVSTVDLIETLKPFPALFSVFSNYAGRFVDAAKQMRENQQDKFVELMGFRQVSQAEASEYTSSGEQQSEGPFDISSQQSRLESRL